MPLHDMYVLTNFFPLTYHVVAVYLPLFSGLQMQEGHKHLLESVFDTGERLRFRGSRWPLFDIRLDTAIMIHHGGQQDKSAEDADSRAKRLQEIFQSKLEERKMDEGYVFSSRAMEEGLFDGAQFADDDDPTISTIAKLGGDGDPLRLSGLDKNRPAKSMILTFDAKSQVDDAGVLEGVKFTNFMCNLVTEASDPSSHKAEEALSKHRMHLRREVRWNVFFYVC